MIIIKTQLEEVVLTYNSTYNIICIHKKSKQNVKRKKKKIKYWFIYPEVLSLCFHLFFNLNLKISLHSQNFFKYKHNFVGENGI